jgi:sulfane dehydrogenase subunit SoxC
MVDGFLVIGPGTLIFCAPDVMPCYRCAATAIIAGERLMARIAPKPTMIETRTRIDQIPTKQLTERRTTNDNLFGTSHLGIPEVIADDWQLEFTGLIDKPATLSFGQLRALEKIELESAYVCAGNPDKPELAMRRAANVVWGGVALAPLLAEMGVQNAASHLWAYGLDYGAFKGETVDHYLKDIPLGRVAGGDVLLAYELNGAPLSAKNGFPARLVVPGYYGTNSVKWLCRLQLANGRPDHHFTELYSDPDYAADPSGKVTKPVWDVSPESLIIAPAAKDEIPLAPTEIWGWAWSNCAAQSVEVSVDGGATWQAADLENPQGRAWQKFIYPWTPPKPGTYDLRCRTTDIKGETQPEADWRNSIYSAVISVTR